VESLKKVKIIREPLEEIDPLDDIHCALVDYSSKKALLQKKDTRNASNKESR